MENLNRVFFKSGLYRFIKHNICSFAERFAQFVQDVNAFPTHSNGRMNPIKELADMFEGMVGAVWVDSHQNLVATGAVIDKLFKTFHYGL